MADGFRFYAQLYRFLGLLFWGVGVTVWLSGVLEGVYWGGAAGLVGGFLWLASGMGFRGASALRRGEKVGRLMLGAFMVGIIAFLSGFVAVVSVVMQMQMQLGVGAGVNLGVVSLVWAVGIGSYLIEVLYLVGEVNF